MTNTSLDNRAAPLPPGSEAPNFELPSTPDQRVSLVEFRGQPVILAFHPDDWSPARSDQMALYQEQLPSSRSSTQSSLGARSLERLLRGMPRPGRRE